MLLPAAAAAWKSSTTITDPAGSLAALLAIQAPSADITPSIASSSAALAPNPGAIARGASMNPVQNRTGSALASSHESQDVAPPSAQPPSSTTARSCRTSRSTTVRRLLAAQPPSSAGLVSNVVGRVVGRNFVSANRALYGAPRPVVSRCATPSLAVPPMAGAETTGAIPSILVLTALA